MLHPTPANSPSLADETRNSPILYNLVAVSHFHISLCPLVSIGITVIVRVVSFIDYYSCVLDCLAFE